ncbi:XrtA/PEP-CTERM system-associated ATPase [Noviherbaspirillum galbum]|uniref:AAA family ATPase n=1 Tax=Noviherbaspirillum galbum TaxID=2709383 RepID=A0A6B3SU27_9BURK|nr:XrtA/PEP-CTERM system-associated ATPase [Noviherbaspirillum galbum]NEX64184.1 AAA family ATPase [Noviherbaspirillum galbum]
MYNNFYGLSAKPFQLNPDPAFFFGSKGHSRAMSYLEYGLSQAEGFIVITGEVGAGKTTLVRNLCRKLKNQNILVAHIVNTALDSGDILRMVVSAFNLPFESISKAALLLRIEQFMLECGRAGKRILLVVDEAQNLSRQALEELRMLSNLQAGDKSPLQTFLLGQPEFRATMMSPGMSQLRQRVIATYHLGPLDAAESKAYIEHRLRTVGWRDDPLIADDAFALIHDYAEGIPRKINTLCDRLFLMGYLEELHAFGAHEVQAVVADIQEEFALPPASSLSAAMADGGEQSPVAALQELEHIEERVSRVETSVISVLDAIRKMMVAPLLKSANQKNQ